MVAGGGDEVGELFGGRGGFPEDARDGVGVGGFGELGEFERGRSCWGIWGDGGWSGIEDLDLGELAAWS